MLVLHGLSELHSEMVFDAARHAVSPVRRKHRERTGGRTAVDDWNFLRGPREWPRITTRRCNMSQCNHTPFPVDPNGATTGSWIIDYQGDTARIVCEICRRFYGYLPTAEGKRHDEEARLRQAYLEQQRRLSCPGCGEEPFLG